MNDYHYACVVDASDIYKDLVLVVENEIYGYTLNAGERLINALCPVLRPYADAPGLVIPRWDGANWEESATAAEIAEWSANNPAPGPLPEPEPTVDELINALLGVSE